MIDKKNSIFPQTLSQVARIILLAISYYISAEISRELASTPQSVTPVWPPDGLAVGALIIWGNWLWSGVFLGSFFANIFAFTEENNFSSFILSSFPVFLIAIGTTLGTLLGAYLLKKFVKTDYPLERIREVLKFLLLTGLLSPIVNATMGVSALTWSGKIPGSVYQTVWLTWWISNVAGIFIITPLILSLHHFIHHYNWSDFTRRFPWKKFRKNPWNIQQNILSKQNINFLTVLLKPVFLLILVFGIAKLAFGVDYHLEYIVIPVLIWTAFCLGQTGGTFANFIVASIAVISTVNGTGGFSKTNLPQSLILLESFIGVITLTILILTAAISERKAAEFTVKLAWEEIAKTNATLESRVQERTEELKERNNVLQQTLKTLKRTQLQMVQSEKMSALGEMVAGIAHEINNPVNFIHGNLDYLSEYTQDLIQVLQSYQKHYPHPPQSLQLEIEELDLAFLEEDIVKILHSMKIGTERICSIVLSLRNFSRLDESELKAVDIHEGIDNTLVILQHRLKAEGEQSEIQVIKNYEDLPKIECFAGQINQVFLNILSNGIDALREGEQQNLLAKIPPRSPQISIHTKRLNEERIAVMIMDNGSGIAEEHRQRLFNPFFTTKEVGKGTGLGLSISYQIITEKHQGNLWFDSTVGVGTKFVIELPIKHSSVNHELTISSSNPI